MAVIRPAVLFQTWAQRVLGPASSIIYIGVGLTALGSLNATFLSAGRLSGVAAKNGQMPDVASWVHVRSKTPLLASGMRCIIAILVMLLADGQQLLRFYIFIVWLFHGTSITALLILRYKNKKKKRPYKVDLWIPVLVVAGIACLVVAPFLQKPEKEFVAAVTLLGMSVVSYYPITWLKSRYIINVPDNITMWLQLFLRVAPKRDLRRERKSMMRQMGVLARNSIIITPSVMTSPAMMRRFSKRMSLRLVQGSPALVHRFGEDLGQTSLRRRTNRGGSLAEIDIRQKMRSNSLWSFGVESKASPAIIRKKTMSPNNRTVNSPDVKLKSIASMPILKNRCTTAPPDVDGATALSSNGLSRSLLSLPHQVVRPTPSPIPEEDSAAAKNSDSGADETKSQISQQDEELQVIADFESDGGGEYEVLAHPEDVRRASYDVVEVPDTNSDSSSSNSSDSNSSTSSKSKRLRRNMFSSLFDSSACSSSDSDSSTDEDCSGDDEEEDDVASRPRFYYSEDEINSDVSGDGSKKASGQVNNGYIAEGSEEDGTPVSLEGQIPTRIHISGMKSDNIPQSEV
ncbi:unnamed protein product [Candidula unifasciata]|uniref:Uncharacterized protein n=1 Tax=Candidula unifasciata TaxID=100452 RepID=A0A8S3YQA7_9EUPU|nr:unnamed protein product [Candidula unifasciata]